MKYKGYVSNDIEEIPLLNDVVRNAEIETIRKAILLAKGNKSLAAEKLGIHRTALYKKLEKYKMME